MKIIDYTAELEALPKHDGWQTLPARKDEQYITFHYSGVVNKPAIDAIELTRIKAETQFHLNKNWGSTAKPAYGDGLMYDYVILTSGTVVQTRARRQQLWHCGNSLGNSSSWSVHVMLGRNQDLTEAQRTATFELFDMLRSKTDIPRKNVFGHCEWPRIKGAPIPSTSYTLLPSQSECPGPVLIQHIYSYRKMSDTKIMVYRTLRPLIVMTDRSYSAKIATMGGCPAIIPINNEFTVDDVTDGWAHMSGGLGFVHTEYIERIS